MTHFEFHQEQLEPLLVDIVPQLQDSRWPRFLQSWEKHPYGLGPKGNRILAALELAAGVLVAVESWSEARNVPADPPKPDMVGLVRLGAVYSAALVLAHEMDRITNHAVRISKKMELRETRQVLNSTDILPAFFRDALLYTQDHVTRGHEADEALCAYAHLLRKTCRSLSEDPRYPASGPKNPRPDLVVGDCRFSLFGDLAPVQENQVLQVELESIVGNRDFLSAGKRLVRDLIAFDPETLRNPKRLNPILFALGKPGCGKTASAHALGAYLVREAAKVNLLAKFCVIRRTDWASAYQNASASALIEKFKSELRNFSGVVAFYWPDIDTAFGARGGADMHAEEKHILGAAFGLFDGTILPSNGQWILLCDANYMQMDDATISRLTQQPFLLEGPVTAQDYVELIRNRLLGEEYRNQVQMTEDQWMELGKEAAQLAVSGRDCAHFTRRLIQKIEDVAYPEGFFQADFEQRVHFLRLVRKTLSLEEVRGEFARTLDFCQAAVLREEDERITGLAKDMVRLAKAEKLAEEELDP